MQIMAELVADPPIIEAAETVGVFDAHKVATLMINSFRFSRGANVSQWAIINFLGDIYGPQFTDAACDESKAMVRQAAHKQMSRPHHQYGVDRTQTTREVDETYERLSNRIAKNERKARGEAEPHWVDLGPPEDSPLGDANSQELLLVGLLEADGKWVHRYGELSRAPGKRRQFVGNFIRYGLLGRETGMVEYDALFRSAAGTFWELTPDRLDAIPDLNFQVEVFHEVVGAHLAFNPLDNKPLADIAARHQV